MRDASSTTEGSKSAGPSSLRLRVGVLLVLLWMLPFWLLAPAIAHALSGGSNSPSVATVTTTIIVVQNLIGLVGLWVAGTQVKSIIKGSTKRHAIAAIWSILLHGDIRAQGEGGNDSKGGRPAREPPLIPNPHPLQSPPPGPFPFPLPPTPPPPSLSLSPNTSILAHRLPRKPDAPEYH